MSLMDQQTDYIMYPKTEAHTIETTDWNEAVQAALRLRKFGSGYECVDGVYTVYWLPIGHKAIAEFAW